MEELAACYVKRRELFDPHHANQILNQTHSSLVGFVFLYSSDSLAGINCRASVENRQHGMFMHCNQGKEPHEECGRVKRAPR